MVEQLEAQPMEHPQAKSQATEELQELPPPPAHINLEHQDQLTKQAVLKDQLEQLAHQE